MNTFFKKYEVANIFVNSLKEVKLKPDFQIGNYTLKFSQGVSSSIQYNKKGVDLLNNQHEYTFELPSGKLELSLQFYLNQRNHYRLFAYSKFQDYNGMTFSINLTTGKESNKEIVLCQKIKFTEKPRNDITDPKEYRRQKAIFLGHYLKSLGIRISTTNDIYLGVYDLENKSFKDTTAERFIKEFITIALVKGHYQENKGSALIFLPTFKYYKF